MTGFLNTHGTYPHIETGQFVSFPGYAWEEDEPDQAISTKSWVSLEELDLSLETPEEREKRIFTDDPSDRLSDDKSNWADEDRRTEEHYDERDFWGDYLLLEHGTLLGAETEAWAEWKYSRMLPHLWEDDLPAKIYSDKEVQVSLAHNPAEDIGELYEHMHNFKTRRHTNKSFKRLLTLVT